MKDLSEKILNEDINDLRNSNWFLFAMFMINLAIGAYNMMSLEQFQDEVRLQVAKEVEERDRLGM